MLLSCILPWSVWWRLDFKDQYEYQISRQNAFHTQPTTPAGSLLLQSPEQASRKTTPISYDSSTNFADEPFFQGFQRLTVFWFHGISPVLSILFCHPNYRR